MAKPQAIDTLAERALENVYCPFEGQSRRPQRRKGPRVRTIVLGNDQPTFSKLAVIGSGPGSAGAGRVSASQCGCDFCRRALVRNQRQRLVWESGLGDEIVLADLCSRCATRADELLERYGGHGRSAVRLLTQTRHSVPAHEGAGFIARHSAPTLEAFGFIARNAIYLIVAVAAFLVVTLVVAHPW
jgi:hypothetical protein